MADQPVVSPQLKLPVICKLFLLDTFNCSRLSFTGWQSRWSSEWMDEWINEWTTKGVGYFGEWCGVGVLLPGRSEGSHELKMRFLSSSDGFTSTALSHDNLKIRLKSQEAAQLWLKRWADCCDWSSFDRLIDWRTCHCRVSDSKRDLVTWRWKILSQITIHVMRRSHRSTPRRKILMSPCFRDSEGRFIN